MDMKNIVEKNPLLAIMRNVPMKKTVDYAQAIINGGVTFFEVALNTPHAFEQIELLSKTFGDKALIGAGTAITVERAKKAIDSGASFLLTPGTPIDVFEYCSKKDLMLLPGVLTPTDVAVSLQYGFSTMKMFPAGDMPMAYVKSLKGPFDNTEYVAIGGVSPTNIKTFLQSGYLGVGLGSNMMPKEAVANGDWEQGTEYVKSLLEQTKF